MYVDSIAIGRRVYLFRLLASSQTHTRQVSIIDPRQQQQQQQCIMEMLSNDNEKNLKDVVDVISMMMMMIPLCSFLYIRGFYTLQYERDACV